MIEFTIPGEPIAQARPRFSTRGGFPRAYDTDKSREYKKLVATVAKQYAPREPLTGPLHLHLMIYRSIPKSFSKTRRLQALAGDLRPITKPDCTNYAKGIEDALNGLIWQDDSQLVTVTISKHYSDEPRVEVSVVEL